MIRIVRKDDRNLEPVNLPGVPANACDPIVGADDCLTAGFSEYVEPCSFEWTFDYHEVFFMIEGSLELTTEGQEPVRFEAGDLGYIEKGTKTTITVPKGAYFLHVTQPAWREA
ncbi:MAG: DUF861 domain-containing protein [bacterium]|nr:DUF861 domain-containing protein [bacterium]